MNIDRWQWHRAFIAEWYEPLTATDGNTEEELEEAEIRLGVRLPDAIREWYSMVGKQDRLVRYQNRLTQIQQLQWESNDDGDDYLTVYSENQWVATWVVYRRDIHLTDPPVFTLYDGESPDADSFSAFAGQMLVLETVISGGRFCRPWKSGMEQPGAWGWTERPASEIAAEHFMRLPGKDWVWPSPPTRFFRDGDTLVMTVGNEELWFTSKSALNRDQVYDLLNGQVDWEQ